MGLGPFDLTGQPFLILYGGLLVLAVIAGIVIPHWLRPEGRERAADSDALAFLAGGKTRFVDALVARLLARGALMLDRKKSFRIFPPRERPAASEEAVLALSSPATWSAVEKAAASGALAIEQRLLRDELMIEHGAAWRLRLLQTAPLVLLLVFGAIKWEVGMLRDRPVGYLTALLILTAVLAAVRFAVVDRRTRGGMAVLYAARAQSDRLRRAPVADETGLAVALFGTVVLSGSAYGDYHTMRSSSDGGSSGDGGGSDGGSGCGGGGGGGGCGGCGS